jgi:hypothetical protein
LDILDLSIKKLSVIYNTLYSYYIAEHSLDPMLVKMTVEYGICHIDTITYIPYNEGLSLQVGGVSKLRQ